jgi:hypothetical protein
MVVVILDCLLGFRERGIEFSAGQQFLLDDRITYRRHCHDEALELEVGGIHENSKGTEGPMMVTLQRLADCVDELVRQSD